MIHKRTQGEARPLGIELFQHQGSTRGIYINTKSHRIGVRRRVTGTGIVWTFEKVAITGTRYPLAAINLDREQLKKVTNG